MNKISEEVIEWGIKNWSRTIELKKISYEVIDVLKMSFQEEFDIVTFKSVWDGVASNGHYDRQELMIENIYFLEM